MNVPGSYRYVRPYELSKRPRPADVVDVDNRDALRRWLTTRPHRDRAEPFTYVITIDGILRLASRQCEHVACADGMDVLGAGEIQFEPGHNGWAVVMISNQSTGYCPDLDSWHAVASAFDRLGVGHPSGFTDPIVFRACTACKQTNVVRHGLLVCGMCGDELPETWNIAQV
jgi:hypothetical protein